MAFLITLASTPLTISLAKKYGLVDHPRERPHPAHIQNRIVPRAGGLPIYLGLTSAILIFLPLDKHLLGILLGAGVLLMMGLLDDKLKNFSPYKRLFFQLLAVGVVVSSGVGIAFFANPLGGFIRLDSIVIPFHLLGPHRIIPLADIVAFIWIVWIMNIVNFAKGVDGQMPGITLIASLTIAALSWKLYSSGDSNQFLISQLALIVAGTASAFLIFNWYPSKIFPGFSGSNILGFMIAVLSILSGAKVATALLVLLIPAVDFIYLVIKRTLSGHSPVWGDRQHLHHKLLELGFTHRQIALFYLISCAILGLLAATLPNSEKSFTILGVGLVSLSAIVWLHYLIELKGSSPTKS